MTTKLSLKHSKSSIHRAIGNLPIIGPVMGHYAEWLEQHGYQPSTVDHHLLDFRQLVRWLQCKLYRRLEELDTAELMVAYRYFNRNKRYIAGPVRSLVRFLRERKMIPERRGPVPPLEAEQDMYGTYLSEVRGLSQTTISSCLRRLRLFFQFLHLDRSPVNFRKLRLSHVEAYLRTAARSNSRGSMHSIVCCLRGFLKFKHAAGQLRQPLHHQIAAPCVYQMEKLPRAISWSKIRDLLHSIDCSKPFGLRDFTMIYLAAAYGLRRSEVTRLTLDDIDWRTRTLRVVQTKAKHTIQLPLTDEAANVLIRYLREARPQSKYRHLFLKRLAPAGPLDCSALHNVLRNRIRLSGLEIKFGGSHMLRHSLAAHLLHQGVAVKAIGDTLGHKVVESTSAYLRLGVEDLRDVALPLPTSPDACRPLDWGPSRHRPRIRPAYRNLHLPLRFQSCFSRALASFVDLKRALGLRYKSEADTLHHWDYFLHRHYPRARRINAEIFSAWSHKLAHLAPIVRRNRQRLIRRFLLVGAREDENRFVPDPLTFSKPSPTLTPRLITGVEMARLLNAARQVPPSALNPLRAETLRIGFVLLFCCGLRSGELLRLKLGDIDRDQGLLHIRLTKFYKSRLVPLSPTVSLEVEHYLKLRRRSGVRTAKDAFLMWSGRGSREVFNNGSLNRLWHRLCVCVLVLNDRGHPPRLHDLRHSFAVGALQRWYARGDNVQAKLPHLATYLGHVNLVSTHYYLKLTPELRQAAADRFHERFSKLFTTGGAL